MDEKPVKKTIAKKDVKKVTFIENVKHKNNRYKKGDSVEIPLEEYELLLNAKVIQAE